MEWFFDDVEKVTELGRVLSEWRGTPFRHWCGVKKQGCDCVHLILKVFEEVGAFKVGGVSVPRYARDWHFHSQKQLLLDTISKVPLLMEVPVKEVRDGDVCTMRFKKVFAHIGIYYKGMLYHAVTQSGVVRSSWNEYDTMDENQRIYRVRKA